MEDKISIVLEAVERAKGVLAQTIADIDKLNAKNVESTGVWTRLNSVLQDHDKLLLSIKIGTAAVLATTLLLGIQAIKTAESYLIISQAAGTTVEQFSTLAFAAKQSNVEVNELALGLKQLQIAAVNASQGASDQASAFKALGVNYRDANGNIKSSNQLLLDVADAFSKAADGPVKATIAQRLFGRSSQELVGFLNQGSAAIKAQQQQAAALGLELSTKTAQAANTFEDNLLAMKGVLQGLANQIIAQLLPALIDLQNFFLQMPGLLRATAIATTSLSAAVAIGTAAWKAYALAGQLAAAALGVGAVKNAKDYLAAIQLVATTPLVAYTAGVAGAVAIIYAGVEAWKAYKAAQQEATSEAALDKFTADTDNRLKAQVKDLVDAGKITKQVADQINRSLSDAFLATGDAAKDQSARAESFARNTIRSANGQGAIRSTNPGSQTAGTLNLPDPALQKAQLDAEDKLWQASIQARVESFANGQKAEQTALDQALSRRTISLNDWRDQQQALDAKAATESTKIEDFKYQTTKENLEKTKALSTDPKEIASVNGQLEALEITHQQTLENIDADAAAKRKQTTQAYYDNQKALAEQNFQLIQTKGETAGSAFQEKLDNIQIGALLGDGLTEFQEINKAQDEYLAKLKDQKSALEDILDVMKTINEANPGTFNTDDLEKVTKAITQNATVQVKTQQKTSQQKVQIQQDELGATTSLLGAAADAAKLFGKKGFLAWKAIAIAQAVVSGAAAVLLQLGGGDPYSAVFRAAAAAAVAAVQIATIAATQPQGYAGGGLVGNAYGGGGLLNGPGTGTSDSIPIMASNREFIVKNTVVEQPGAIDFLQRFNALGMDALTAETIPAASRSARFAGGGLIDSLGGGNSPQASGGLSVGLLDTRNHMRRFLRQEGVKIVIDQMRQRGNSVVA